MKKMTGFFSVIFLIVGSCWAASVAPDKEWIEQVDGGFVFPVSTAVSAGYDRGFGSDILMGYRFDTNFSLSGDVGYYVCDQNGAGGTTGSWAYTPLMLVARLNIGTGWIRPFLSLGAGVAFNSYSTTLSSSGLNLTYQETDPLLAPGLGILFPILDNAALYFQGRLDMNFTNSSTILGKPITESPTFFIPVKAGISFLVL